MYTFAIGRNIELSAREMGGISPDSVVLDSLTKNEKEVGVQQTFFSLGDDGQYHLSLPTQDLAPGHYDVKVAAVQGGRKTTLIKDSFVLNR
jgi:hypothetical protein